MDLIVTKARMPPERRHSNGYKKMSKEFKVYNFMRWGKLSMSVSVLCLIISIGSLLVNGLNFGLDFTGGTQIEMGYDRPADLEDVRERLTGAGFEGAVVMHFGGDTDVLIRLQRGYDDHLGNEILTALTAGSEARVEVRRVEFVGPQVGEELKVDGGLGMLFAMLVVMAYVAMRFQFKFSVSAVLGLAHDAIIVVGVFSIFQLEFDLTVLAAILAVIGYSINDTIVVFDRIRENFRKLRGWEVSEIINGSVTQTLDRTIITSGSTALVLVAMLIFGGEILYGFALALLIGVAVGTYSTVFVASYLLMLFGITKEDLMPPVKEDVEQGDEVP